MNDLVIERVFHSSSVLALFLATDGIPRSALSGQPDAGRFSVTVNGAQAAIAEILVRDQVFLRLANPIPSGAVVRVAYQDSPGDQTQGVLQAEDGADVPTTAQALVSTAVPPRQVVALAGASFGITDRPDFPEPDYYVYADNSPPPTLTVVGSSADSVFLGITTTPLEPNPRYSASASSGYASLRYATDYAVAEVRKSASFNPPVGTSVELLSAISWGAGMQTVSIVAGAAAGNAASGAGAQVYELMRVSFFGVALPTWLFIAGVAWNDDDFTGSAQADRFDAGGFGNDTLRGEGGDDLLVGGAGNDSLDGGPGRDELVGGPGNDTLDGGAITDRVRYTDGNILNYASSPAGVVVNLQAGRVVDGHGSTDVVRNITFVTGTPFADTFFGSGEPVFEFFTPGPGDDFIDGGALSAAGFNRVGYADAPAAVRVTLATGIATGGGGNDTLVNINQVRGSRFNDTLTGSDRTDVVEAFEDWGGNDTIDGAGGVDELVYAFGATRGVVVDLAGQSAQDARDGTDVLLNIENVRGSPLADSIRGSAGPNVLRGQEGGDSLYGAGGNDALWGDVGDDLLAGEDGNDTLVGAEGNDMLQGGAGVDTATFSATRAQATVARSATGFQVASTVDGVDTLDGIERIVFADRKLAFDLDGNAGSAALFIGAVAGRPAVAVPGTVTAVLGLLDSGVSLAGLCDLVVSSGLLATIAGGSGNAVVARHLLGNVLGTTPAPDLVSGVAALLDLGLFTQAGLLGAAIALEPNRAGVGLVGLSSTGLEYL